MNRTMQQGNSGMYSLKVELATGFGLFYRLDDDGITCARLGMATKRAAGRLTGRSGRCGRSANRGQKCWESPLDLTRRVLERQIDAGITTLPGWDNAGYTRRSMDKLGVSQDA